MYISKFLSYFALLPDVHRADSSASLAAQQLYGVPQIIFLLKEN